MKVNFNLIYGGFLTYNKKDKNGNKTEEKATMYNLIEKDEEKHIANVKAYNLDGDNPLNIVDMPLLAEVVATIDISATNNYQKLIDLKSNKKC